MGAQHSKALQLHQQHQQQQEQMLAAAPAPAPAQATQMLPTEPTDWQLERKYTFDEIQMHSSLDDCWMVIFDKVYDITEFVDEHPGGDFILLEYAGRDATRAFLSTRHGSSAYKMLDKYWIGILVDEELYYSNNSSYCSVYSNLSWRATSPTLNTTNLTTTDSITTTTTSSSSSSEEDDADSGISEAASQKVGSDREIR